MAKKVIAEIKLQIPAGAGEPEPAGRAGARPARREHHGVLQGVQRQDAGAAGDDHPGDHHRLRGPLVHLHHQDAAGRRCC